MRCSTLPRFVLFAIWVFGSLCLFLKLGAIATAACNCLLKMGHYIQGQSNEYSGGQVGDSISSPPGDDLQKNEKLSVEDDAIVE